MGWLNVRRSRGFRHTYLYVDECREQVRRARSRVQDAEPDLTPAMFDAGRRMRRAGSVNMQIMLGILIPLLMLGLVIAVCLFLF